MITIKNCFVLLVLLLFLYAHGCININTVSDSSQCSHLSNKFSRDNCYIKVARMLSKDATRPVSDIDSACKQIKGGFGIGEGSVETDNCYYTSAIYRLSVKQEGGADDAEYLCSKIVDRMMTNECYYYLAAETGDEKYCRGLELNWLEKVGKTYYKILGKPNYKGFDYHTACVTAANRKSKPFTDEQFNEMFEKIMESWGQDT